MKKEKTEEYPVSEPLSTTLNDGRTVTGTLWCARSGIGSFEVEYNGVRKTDGRSDYADHIHMVAIAKLILRELA